VVWDQPILMPDSPMKTNTDMRLVIPEFANLFAEIDELYSAACRFTRDVQANERAEAHAVHAGKVCEIEHYSLGAGDELPDFVVEGFADACQQTSVASHDGSVARKVNFKGKHARGCFVSHWTPPLLEFLGAGNRYQVILAYQVRWRRDLDRGHTNSIASERCEG